MNRKTVPGNVLALLAFAALLGGLSGCAAVPAVGAADERPQDTTHTHTLVLARGQQGVIESESLTLSVTAINDSRCPAKVTCVWAGHAAVTLQVRKPGVAPASLQIGTQAPAAMGLPYEAGYAGYRLHLLALEAVGANNPSPRATIRVSRN